MAKLVWDQTGERYYENGVSQGVFYGADSKGIPWNGLTSVESSGVDSADALYFDGFKYADLVTLGDFEGKMKAFTYPDEFLAYEGVWEAEPGFFLAHQPKTRFGLSYRTEINNDIGQSVGYKIHLLYNLLAIPTDTTYETLSLDNEPFEFEWNISAIPEEVDNFRPTGYVMIDSRKIDPFLLADLEDLLYGDTENDAKLPDLKGLVSFVMKWGRLIITDNGDGTWTATSPLEGVIEMVSATEFEITSDTAVYIDSPTNETYEISSSEKNEEDIWPP
jgi:hypothetical protein